MDESQLENRGKQWLGEFVRLAGLSAEIVADSPNLHEDGSFWLTISDALFTDKQVEALIGESGETLDSIQYLINATLNIGQPKDQQHAYTIELGGYRLRRQAELKAIAEQAAQQVRETGQEYEIPSLSSAERRQVHTFLKVFDDIQTYSRGQEPDRRLIVHLKGTEP
ncbi:MAG TPA: R3H domain-containing nucleic acid-binding protein [Chroococcidiopsis sp.]